MRRVRTFKKPRRGWKSLDVLRKPSAVEMRQHEAAKTGTLVPPEGLAAARRKRQIERGQLKAANGLKEKA